MAINPQIVMPQIQGVQLENPMTFAKNALAMKQAQSEIAANELAAQRARKLAEMIAAAGQPGANALTPQALMAAGFFAEAEKMSGAQKEARLASKAESDAIGAAMDTSARLLDTVVRTPEDMMAWHEANHADPVLGPYLASRGVTAEKSRAKILEAAKDPVAFQQLVLDSRLGLEKSREQHFIEQEYGGGTRVLGMGKYGGPARVVPGSDIAVTPSPNRSVTTITLPPLEKEERGEKGKLNVRVYEDIRNRAASAGRLLPKIRASRAVLDKGFETGLFAPAKAEAARFLSAIGVQDASQYAADAQTFKSTAQERVLERQLEQKGTQTTADAARMEQTFARLGNEVEANRFLFDVAEAQAKYEIETRKFWDNWWNKNGTYEGVEDAWDKAGGAKSIFDDPKLKKYVEPGQEAAANAPVRVNSADEAKKLKPGTIFITPDGRQ
jgi:hypothetical protein